MSKLFRKHLTIMIIIGLVASTNLAIYPLEKVTAGSSDGWDLATAILANQSTLINAQYTDRDQDGCRQSVVLSSLGTMIPTDGSTFLLMSTGIAGLVPVTTDGTSPGDESGTWYRNRQGNPRACSCPSRVQENAQGPWRLRSQSASIIRRRSGLYCADLYHGERYPAVGPGCHSWCGRNRDLRLSG